VSQVFWNSSYEIKREIKKEEDQDKIEFLSELRLKRKAVGTDIHHIAKKIN